MDITAYNALVLMHPHLDTPQNSAQFPPFNPNYSKNLQLVCQEFFDNDKPVFLADGPDKPENRHYDLLRNQAIKVPRFKPQWDNQLVSQKDVYFVANTLGKNPEDITIAIGGLWAHACVYALARDWCENIETNHPGDRPYFLGAKKRLKLGVVLDEII
tara:strand:- start:3303 stop:3776 length:474 start_codon:yes stop_codon:yes gene_type:complete